MRSKIKSAKSGDKHLAGPTTEARLQFVKRFSPKWMKIFANEDWQVAHRLAEELEENFQFVNNGIDRQLYERVSLCHIIVCQQLEINR